MLKLVAFISHASKVMLKILQARLQQNVEEEREDNIRKAYWDPQNSVSGD